MSDKPLTHRLSQATPAGEAMARLDMSRDDRIRADECARVLREVAKILRDAHDEADSLTDNEELRKAYVLQVKIIIDGLTDEGLWPEEPASPKATEPTGEPR